MPQAASLSPLDVLVIGAGASGLFCAHTAAKRGRRVSVIDHGRRTGSKVRVSGGGRCNFTNTGAGPADYVSQNPDFCRSALARFTPGRFTELLAAARIAWSEEEDGKLFCRGGAGQIAHWLEASCRGQGVAIGLGCEVQSVTGPRPYTVRTSLGTLSAPRLVIATGGPSWPRLGATPFAFGLAEQFGIPVIEPRPGLTPFLLSGPQAALCATLAGLSLPVALATEGMEFRGGFLFTHKGVSGPAVFDASLRWRPGRSVSVDFLPGLDLEDELRRTRSAMLLKNLLARRLPSRLVAALLPPDLAATQTARLSAPAMQAVAAAVKNWTFTPAALEGYDAAEVTLGGIDTRHISSKTMECRDHPGLHFVGECLDVTGRLGGFNLHWAWASGFAAGSAV